VVTKILADAAPVAKVKAAAPAAAPAKK
jgi:hypothetical protein